MFLFSDAQLARLAAIMEDKPRGVPRVLGRRVISRLIEASHPGGSSRSRRSASMSHAFAHLMIGIPALEGDTMVQQHVVTRFRLSDLDRHYRIRAQPRWSRRDRSR